MNNMKSVLASCAVSALVVLAFASVPVAAVNRHDGDFWTYEVTLNVEGYTVNGTMTYTFAGTDTIAVGGTSYPVNVMRISGGATQSISFLNFEISVAFGGFVYETQDKMALVKNDLYMWTNMTLGSGSFQLVERMQTEIMMTYSPALLSGFDPGVTAPGDSWAETVNVTSTTTEWDNGTMQGSPETTTDLMSFSFSVDSAVKAVTTGAGTFECLKITATSSDEIVVYYWSDKANNYVKEDSFEPGSTVPSTTLSLKDYKTSSGLSTILFVGVGVGVLAIALIVLALVVMKKRKPVAPVSYPMPMPPPPPPQQ